GAQSAQEQPGDERIGLRLECATPEDARDVSEQTAPLGEKRVRRLAQRSEARQIAIEPPPPAPRRRKGQQAEGRRGAGVDAPIGEDELHRALELRKRDLRKIYPRLLVGAVGDAVAR